MGSLHIPARSYTYKVSTKISGATFPNILQRAGLESSAERKAGKSILRSGKYALLHCQG